MKKDVFTNEFHEEIVKSYIEIGAIYISERDFVQEMDCFDRAL